MKRLIEVLLCIAMFLMAGCNPQNPEPAPTPEPDPTTITSTVYTNKSPMFSNPYRPKIEFFSDGTFVMTESLLDAMGTYKGTYTLEDNKYYRCKVAQTSFSGYAGDDVTEIVFVVIDDERLMLDSNLCGSTVDDVFVKGNVTDPVPTPTPEPTPDPTPEPTPDPDPVGYVYNNTAVNRFSPGLQPVLTLYEDGTFNYLENFFEGMINFSGTYKESDGTIVCTTEKADNPNFTEKPVIEFCRVDEKHLVVRTQLSGTFMSDVYVLGEPQAPVEYHSTAIERYNIGLEPVLYLYPDGFFRMYENALAGMVDYFGTYTEEAGTYHLTAILGNFKGDPKPAAMTFTRLSESMLRIENFIYGTQEGDTFIKK
ncbi:MAG: hypothetical protein IIZ48_00795 [Erysipelotrichales bacterium]|nr:hypothetical protein [Erysipelotrichales bacterium]